MLARGNLGAVYFVDDNFIAHRRAARQLVTHLIDWQKRNGYRIVSRNFRAAGAEIDLVAMD